VPNDVTAQVNSQQARAQAQRLVDYHNRGQASDYVVLAPMGAELVWAEAGLTDGMNPDYELAWKFSAAMPEGAALYISALDGRELGFYDPK
jgi:hypothetical protein